MEDLVVSGDSEHAIALIESVVLKVETLTHSETADHFPASALTDLAKLYSSKSFSRKSNELLPHASVLKQRAIRNLHSSAVQNVEEDSRKEEEASSSVVGLDYNNLSVSVDAKYGTQHVLVLAEFSPIMFTIDLEKLFQDFRDLGIAVHWRNDTTSLTMGSN